MENRIDKIIPIATALRESLRHGYSLRNFGHDLMAAVVVSLVALPLAIAVGLLPPQHGIYTAIVAVSLRRFWEDR